MFTITAKDKNARTGVLRFKSGNEVTTPFFMPVCTKGTVKLLPSTLLLSTKTRTVISNSLILSLKPGLDVLEAAGGYKHFARLDTNFFTDSGGYQMRQKGWFESVSKRGIHFRNPYDKSKLVFTPEQSAALQERIGSDVAMILDDVVPYPSEYTRCKEAVERTKKWTERFLKVHSRKNQLVFAITQGSIFADLREDSTRHVASLDVDGYAIGGLAFGEPVEDMNKMIALTLTILPEDKPRYKMGLGSPLDILQAIFEGMDIFDSTFPTMNARHGRVFTRNGYLDITKQAHKFDLGPLDPTCTCFTCTTYTRAFLRHLFDSDERIGHTYATIHNIYFVQQMIEEAREAIRGKVFKKYKEEFEKKWKAQKEDLLTKKE